VVNQLNPKWNESGLPEEDALKHEISNTFKLTPQCRLIEDTVLYRISADKKLQIHVQSIKNLNFRGHFAVFIACISNEVVSFNKESFIFMNYDLESDSHNPVFKEKQVVFGDVDLSDESSFCLIAMVEIKKHHDEYSFEVYGINVIPSVSSSDTVINGAFEVPMLDLELSGALFQELNNISPWQFQYRFLKEKKCNAKAASIIYRQNNASIGDMYPKQSCQFEISSMFMPASDKFTSTQIKSNKASSKMDDHVHKSMKRDAIEHDIKEFIKKKLYSGI
jgi:hypothetical protein